MEKVVSQKVTRTPEEKIWIGIIQQAFEDSFELGMGHNLSMQRYSKQEIGFILKHVLMRVIMSIQLVII